MDNEPLPLSSDLVNRMVDALYELPRKRTEAILSQLAEELGAIQETPKIYTP